MPCTTGRDSFSCFKVDSEVQLKDLVDVIPDIQKLEAEVIAIIQEVCIWLYVLSYGMCVHGMHEGPGLFWITYCIAVNSH